MNALFAAATDVGRKRPQNEDAYCADPALGLYLVADGMGGHAAGEVASWTVADAVRAFIASTQPDDLEEEEEEGEGFEGLSEAGSRLRAAVLAANEQLARRIAGDAHLSGMATTLSAMLLAGQRVVVSNVGDCRAYLIRNGTMTQITDDHSWVAEQVRAGALTIDAARMHPWRSVVTRALTGFAPLEIDVVELETQPGDLLLLCSDGVHSVVSDEEMLQLLGRQDDDLARRCRALVDQANAHGGPDNATALLVAVA